MRLGIFSDIHANYEALSAVLEAYGPDGIDVYHCLGDTVGYGGSPNECANLVREHSASSILGNHDAAVAGRTLEQRSDLLDKSRARDRELLTLAGGNIERARHIVLLKEAASSGLNLVKFADHLRDCQSGPVVLTKLTFQPGKLNDATDRCHVILTGTIGSSTRTHQDVLTEFRDRLVEYLGLDPPDPKNVRLVERGRETADGTAWEFRMRVPLRALPVEETP